MILVADDLGVLNAKDIEWSSKHMSTQQSTVEESELPADDQQPSEQPTKRKVKSRLEKYHHFFDYYRPTELIKYIHCISKQFDAVESKFPIGNNWLLALGPWAPTCQDDKYLNFSVYLHPLL